MKGHLVILVTFIAFSGSIFFLSAYSDEPKQMMMGQNSMGSMTEMCKSMMNSIPQDVIIKTTSSQVANINEESKITLFVTDKSGKPLNNANIILHIEKGAPMESMENMNMMDMMKRMSEAENIGSGNYLVKFTPTDIGYYTMHTHAITQGKSMMSMMNNHMDIGIIVK